MNEKKVLEKIEQSAEKIQIPKHLQPEEVKKMISVKKRNRNVLYRSAAAVIALMLCGALCYPALLGTGQDKDAVYDGGVVDTEMASGRIDGGIQRSDVVRPSTSSTSSAKEIRKPKQNAGSLYTIAKDYGEVYDVFEERGMLKYEYDMGGGLSDGAMEESLTGAAESEQAPVKDLAVRKLAADAAKEYSRTNLQTEGVDESDFVKTDGEFIYVVKGNSVIIVDARGDKPVRRGKIVLQDEGASDDVLEMYVDGNVLNILVQREVTELEQDSDEVHKSEAEDVYHFATDVVTEVMTYDIRDRAKPVLKGSMRQDGYYQSSRKIGNIIYLFTGKGAEAPEAPRNQAIKEENVGGWIPLVNGKAVAYDSIYLSESGTQGLLISSVDVRRPKETIDQTYILNDYAEIYVSQEALYLYYNDYRMNSGTRTNIAKFSLSGGRIDAAGAAAVKGVVKDTFAVNESTDEKLRILTTMDGWNTDEEGSCLYILDEKLKLIGKLDGIAPGEQVYAARYFGNMAYFVTYRNTDPLFAVDLSDDTNPRLLGELKITGFSEYLHFWGDDRLVGIGYETDPDTGERKGMKITMFDISDPIHLKELKSLVIKDIDYSDALYDYKSVLADAGQNLLGFPVESYGAKDEYKYLLFEWDGKAFKELLAESFEEKTENGSRGMYIGEKFIIATTEKIMFFDRNEGYEFVANLVL